MKVKKGHLATGCLLFFKKGMVLLANKELRVNVKSVLCTLGVILVRRDKIGEKQALCFLHTASKKGLGAPIILYKNFKSLSMPMFSCFKWRVLYTS